MDVKMIKLADDPCFGKHYEKNPQCTSCWIKNSCLVSFRNRK
jgi:hypothetical protein